jgi:hypothetical protein
MTVRIHHIALTKAQLEKIPEAERSLFTLLAHASNEVGVLSKLFHFAIAFEGEQPVLVQAEQAQANLLGRLLTGKIYEFWELLQNGYFGAAISRTYHPLLDAETAAALDAMKKYFSQDNLIKRVRNSHAFHYDVKQISAGFNAIVDGDPLDIYLSQTNANTLYSFAETISLTALMENIQPGDPRKAFDSFIAETLRAADWVGDVVAGLMHTCLERYLGGDLYSLGAKEVDIEGAPSSQEVRIPYFIEVPDGGNQRSPIEGNGTNPKETR